MRVPAVLLLLLCASPAWALENSCPIGGSDGQRVGTTAGTTETAGKVASPSFNQTAFWLCCNRDTGACTDKDVGGANSAYLFSLEDLNTCTAVDVTIGFRNEASGVLHTVGTLSLGTTSLVVNRPANRRIAAVVNNSTGCAAAGAGGEVDVRVDVLDQRNESQ